MAFRIPPKPALEWVPAIQAAAAVFELAPDLDPNAIKNAIEEAVAGGTLITRDIDVSLLADVGVGLQFNWSLDGSAVCIASQSVSPLLWQWVPFVLRQEDVLALFQDPADEPPTKRTTGKAPTVKSAIKARILAALRAGRDIGDRDHDAITAEFGGGASRGTCVAALREALSAFRSE